MRRRIAARLRRRRMKKQGFADGIASRPALYVDVDYQRSWRKGQETRNAQLALGELRRLAR